MDAGTARLQQQLQASFASQQRQLGPAVSTAVGEALRSDAMAGLLSTAVSQPLHDALTAAFAQQLIPKFESAAAALFQQVIPRPYRTSCEEWSRASGMSGFRDQALTLPAVPQS